MPADLKFNEFNSFKSDYNLKCHHKWQVHVNNTITYVFKSLDHWNTILNKTFYYIFIRYCG